MDADSNVTMIDHEGWITDFAIDPNRRRASIMADGGMPVADYLFAGPGVRTAQVSMVNSAQMNASFDGFAREAGRDWFSAPHPIISSFTNTYNNRHERISETWNHYAGFFTDVTLDSVSRTVASRFKTDPATLIPVEDCSYEIDGVDNRISMTTNGVPTGYVSNAINSYPNVGGVKRVHDPNGNLVNDGTLQYTYNYRNELIEVRRVADGFLLGTYTYDPFGRRVSREYWDAQAGIYRNLRYVYNDWQVKAEYESGSPEVLFCRYAYGNGIDEPLMLEVRDINDIDGDYNTNEYLKYYYHRDTLSSITHMTDAGGSIVERYECTPFGQTYIYTNPGPDMAWNTPDDIQATWSRIYNTYIFQARRFDEESEFYYFRTRHYDTSTGRFIQRDRLGDCYDESNLGNGYNFVGFNPISRIDPLGTRKLTPAERLWLQIQRSICTNIGMKWPAASTKCFTRLLKWFSRITSEKEPAKGERPRQYFDSMLLPGDLPFADNPEPKDYDDLLKASDAGKSIAEKCAKKPDWTHVHTCCLIECGKLAQKFMAMTLQSIGQQAFIEKCYKMCMKMVRVLRSNSYYEPTPQRPSKTQYAAKRHHLGRTTGYLSPESRFKSALGRGFCSSMATKSSQMK